MSGSALGSLLFSIFVGGFIGWITNLLAIKALFHPQVPWNFRLFSFQGLLPKRKPELAENLGDIVEGELINVEALVKNFKPDDLDPFIQAAVRDYRHKMFPDQKIGKPSVQATLLKPIVDIAETFVVETIRKETPALVEKVGAHLAQKISVKDIVREKVLAMDLDKLEALINRISNREMKMIEWMGGVLGMLVGALQWLIQKALT